MSPATTPGAATKKSAEPRMAIVIVRLHARAGQYGAIASNCIRRSDGCRVARAAAEGRSPRCHRPAPRCERPGPLTRAALVEALHCCLPLPVGEGKPCFAAEPEC